MKNTLSKLAVLITTTLSLSTVAFEAAAANSIVGGWHLSNAAGVNSVVTFLNDGTYFHVMDSVDTTIEGGGNNGMEYGTYSYNEAASKISFNTLIDTNGGWGANSEQNLDIFVTQNTMQGDGNWIDTRITSDSNPIIGSWLSEGSGGGRSVVTFLTDGTYFQAQYGTPDALGWSGMERGTYSWNQLTGKLDMPTVQIDTNGDRGPSDNGTPKNDTNLLTFVNYNTIEISRFAQSDFTLTRIAPVPEADTSAMLLMGAGVMGFMARRRKHATV